MAFYQTVKFRSGTVAPDVTYCSSKKYKNHDEGAAWVKALMEHFGLTSANMVGKPKEADSQPDGATIWGPPNAAADVHHYE